MAEGSAPNPEETVCPTFITSPPAEDSPHTTTSSRRVKNCWYFQNGTCRFGRRCHFSHTLNTNSVYSMPPVQHHTDEQLVAEPTLSNLSNLNEPGNEALSENMNAYEPEARSSSSNPPNWVNAQVFIPRSTLSYANVVRFTGPSCEPPERIFNHLCPEFIIGECQLHDQCPYIHGDICDMCGLAILNPQDEDQRKEHTEACEKEMEQDMELSFAVQRSVGKSCNICLDIVVEKQPLSERRFGILDNCSHIFCLSCIRRWRQQKNTPRDSDMEPGLTQNVTRTCPTCRVTSDFIIPSRYWVETPEEKQKLIADYKTALSKKPCKYFNQGKNKCPFGGYCFYLHALADGTKIDLPKPERRRRQNQNGELDVVDNVTLWEFLESRDDRHIIENDGIYYFSSSSDSESSGDSEIFWSRTAQLR